MRLSARQNARFMTACLLVFTILAQGTLWAQTHVVAPGELQTAAAAATQSRQQNVKTVSEFLSSPQANTALQAAGISPQQVKTAVPTLSDQELQKLASHSVQAQADFAAGALSNRDLLWIVVAIAALILIIVAVR